MNDKNLKKDLELIVAHLLGKPISPGDLQKAVERVAVDAEAMALFEKLSSILSGGDDPIWLEAVAAARDGVITPEIADFLAGQKALAHLGSEIEAEVATLLAATTADEFVEPPPFPNFVEQFETRAKSETRQETQMKVTSQVIWEATKAAGQQILRLFTEIPVIIGRETASFGRLVDPLASVEIVSPSVRGREGEAQKLGQTLPLTSDELGLSLNLKIGPSSNDTATLSVQVFELSSQQPVRRARVSFRNIESDALESDITREDGTVTFQDIEIGRYMIEVRYLDKSLELPITFMPNVEV